MNPISLNLAALRLAFKQKPVKKRNFRLAKRYLLDRAAFIAAGGQIATDLPMLLDLSDQAGSVSGHYFHQDLLIAGKIFATNPVKHVDVGSRIDGFVAHVAAFRDIEVFDIRPLKPTAHPQIRFIQGDLMKETGVPQHYCDSLSCLHAIEHFGLGRYGDPIDPDGHRKGFKNLTRLLKPGGTLYISFPIGSDGIEFNAHRILPPCDIFEWPSIEQYELKSFDYVDDRGDLQRNAHPSRIPALHHGCGIYTFTKLA